VGTSIFFALQKTACPTGFFVQIFGLHVDKSSERGADPSHLSQSEGLTPLMD